jgi:hypothetical protein
MRGENPYNCTEPGTLFVGYDRLRKELLNGFCNGNSYAILGGRRCGKTSLLLQIEKDTQSGDLAPFTPLPRFLDIQGLGQVTPASLFQALYNLVVKEITVPPWVSGELGNEYQTFLAHLDSVSPLLTQRYGTDWLVILLIDELDAAIATLPDDQFFQNLRNLLMISRFHRYFRLVASGVTQMANLISSGCSPLNNLRNKHLSILTGKQARELIRCGFPNGLGPEVEETLFRLTGRHPYLLQGLLEKFWEIRETEDELDVKAVKGAAREFLREHRDFVRWLDAFGPAEHAVYQLLSEAPGGTLSVREIRQRINPALAFQTEEALTILSYHGVIDDSDPDEPQIAGTLFQVWYRENRPPPPDKPPGPESIRLFYSYSHKDETLREKLETHLSLLRKEGYIHDWHDRKIGAGQEWKNSIDGNLEAAKIILLLVSSDFIASDYCYGIEMKRALENHRVGEAQVIPIILRPCDWDKAPFAKLQALPKDAKPVMKWSNRDEAWTDVARGIRRVVEELRKRLFKED